MAGVRAIVTLGKLTSVVLLEAEIPASILMFWNQTAKLMEVPGLATAQTPLLFARLRALPVADLAPVIFAVEERRLCLSRKLASPD